MHPIVIARKCGTFVARLGTAAGVITAVNWLFDYPFTGWTVWHFGSLLGGAIILVSAPILNYAIVRWYRQTTPDWFGMEWLRAQEAINTDSWSGRLIRVSLRTSRLFAFTALASLLDPTYAFIFQRGRMTGVRFTAHDWAWFGAANAIGIFPWLVGVSVIVETLQRATA